MAGSTARVYIDAETRVDERAVGDQTLRCEPTTITTRLGTSQELLTHSTMSKPNPKVEAATCSADEGAAYELTLQEAVDTLRHDREMKRAVLGIPFPVVYFCVFVAMLYQHVPSTSLYEQGASVSSVLDSSGTDAITASTTMKFQNVQTIADVFDWLTDTFVPSVFITEDYNSNLLTKDKWGRIAMFNKVLGAVYLEVTRAQIHPCNAVSFLVALYPNCYNPENTSTDTVLISFDTNSTEATDVISKLKAKGDWLDFSTQQLLISVVTYNGELQGYTVSKLQIDFKQGGYLDLSSSTTPTISDPYKANGSIIADVLVALCFLVGLIDPTKRLVTSIRTRGLSAIRDFSLWVIVSLASTICIVIFYVLWFWLVTMMYTKEFRDNLARLVVTGKKFDANSDERLGLLAVTKSLEQVADITVALRLVAMCAVFALGINILRQFRFHPRLSILTRTVANALHQFAAFFVVFIVIFMTFSVSGMVLFGDQVKDFSTLPHTMESCINMLFGNFDYSTIQDLQAPVGMLYYWAYMIVVCLVLLNMMLAIVLDSYSEISAESANIKRNVSFRRTFHHVLYDIMWLAVGPGRKTAVVLNKSQATTYEAKFSRDVVMFRGRVIPLALEKALEAKLEKTQSGSELVTLKMIVDLFPGASISHDEAAHTFLSLLHGLTRTADIKEINDAADINNESQANGANDRPGAPTSPPREICHTPVSSLVLTGDAGEFAQAAERMARLERKLDILLSKM